MNAAPVTYDNGLTDSTRWNRVALRPGDIIISAPSKCGTTWIQMICALLIFQTPDLPAPLTTLSPWLDMRLRPLDEVLQALHAQQHRRFIKTHTPLDGLPQAPGVSSIVVGRDPRDVAVSMDYHRANLNRDVIAHLTTRDSTGQPPPEPTARPADPRGRIVQWLHDPRAPTQNMNSLRGVVHHLSQAWQRRTSPAITVLHHADLRTDLPAQMRYLADRLDIAVPQRSWPPLVQAATFAAMRARARHLVPDERLALLASPQDFFRTGTSGQWHDILTESDLTSYERLLRSMADADVAAWLHDGAAATRQPT